jgi:outer membrane protein assembly factor BamB
MLRKTTHFWLLPLLALSVSASSVGLQELQQVWELPLGLGTNAKTNIFASTMDQNTIYLSDTRGAIFAVSSSGEVLWSNPGNASLATLLLFPKAGIVVAGWSATQTFAHAMGISTVDGSMVWNLEVPFTPVYGYSDKFMFFATAETLPSYIWAIDVHTGNLQWNVSNPLGLSFAIAASESIIALTGMLSNGTQATATFDAMTGAPLCLFAGLATPASSPFVPLLGELLVLSSLPLPAVVYNGRSCSLVQTFAPGTSVSIDAFVAGSNMFITVSNSTPTTSGKWEWNVTMLDRSGSVAWVLNWPAFDDSALAPQFAFHLGNSSDVVLQIYGRLGAVDTATGKLRWIFAHRIPIAPPNALNQALFPIGERTVSHPKSAGLHCVRPELEQRQVHARDFARWSYRRVHWVRWSTYCGDG